MATITNAQVEALARQLLWNQIDASTWHAGMTDEQRTAAIAADVEAWWHLKAEEAARMFVDRAIAGQKAPRVIRGWAFCTLRSHPTPGGQKCRLEPSLRVDGSGNEFRAMNVRWRPHHEVYPELPPKQDFLAFDEATEDDIDRVYIEKHSSIVGRWKWSMYAHSTAGRVPFETSRYEDSRSDAGRCEVEASGPSWRTTNGAHDARSGCAPPHSAFDELRAEYICQRGAELREKDHGPVSARF